MEQVAGTTFGNIRAIINDNFNEIDSFMQKLANFMNGEKIAVTINQEITADEPYETTVDLNVDPVLLKYGIGRTHGWIGCPFGDRYEFNSFKPVNYINYTLSRDDSTAQVIEVEATESMRSFLSVVCWINDNGNKLNIRISHNNINSARTINTTLTGYVF